MNKKKGIWGIISLYGPYKGAMIVNLVATAIMAVGQLVFPLLMKYVTDIVVFQAMENAARSLVMVAAIYVGLIIVETGCNYVGTVIGSHTMDKIEQSLRKKVFDHYQELPFSYYDNSKPGTILSLMEGDINTVDEFMWELPNSTASILMQIVLAPTVFMFLNARLMKSVAPLLVAFLVFELVFVKRMRSAFQKVREVMTHQMEFAEDKLSGIRTVVSFNNQKSESYEFKRRGDESTHARKTKWRMIFTNNSACNFFDSGIYLVILVYGGWLAATGEISVTDMTLFYAYSYCFINPVRNMTSIIKDYQSAVVSYDRVRKFLEVEPEIKNPKNAAKPVISGEVEFKNISFRYDKDGTENVLDGIDLEIKAGELIGIVGPSGSGKSTIAGLIPRYYDTTDGAILIDGINVRDIDLGHLRRHVGCVQQDVYLFNGTVYDNIAYAVPNASMDKVIRAAKMANAHEFIGDLPNGYQSEVGDRGVKLSGGQKQRIAIARLFLENPSILIFDEATSALDEESQEAVQKAMEKLSKDRTTIVIAHRLSTIHNADRIIYLSKFGVEEEGTHDELLKKDGKYAAMVRKSQKDQ